MGMKAKAAALAVTAIALSGCMQDADVASHNLSRAADNFGIERRIVFYNGITDSYMLTIEGLCSVRADGVDKQLEVTCKTGAETFKKHFLGLSDNVTYFVEQIGDAKVGVYHYEVTFRPQSIIPDVDFRGDADELLRNRSR
jgi:hypothetical protein